MFLRFGALLSVKQNPWFLPGVLSSTGDAKNPADSSAGFPKQVLELGIDLCNQRLDFGANLIADWTNRVNTLAGWVF